MAKRSHGVVSITLATLLAGGLQGTAFAQAGPKPDGQAGGEAATPDPGEIVVTATRRSETVLKVPSNISAISSKELLASGASSIADITRLTPGVVIQDEGARVSGNRNTLIIRGLNANSMFPNDDNPSETQEAVSTYFGETPVFYPLKLVDVERVEILRGPQGTLYGSGSVGGTMRIIPKKPKLGLWEGEISAEGSLTDHSSDPNYKATAILNIPLGESVALRVSGGREHDGGFIDALNLAKYNRTGTFDPGTLVLADPANPMTSDVVREPRKNDVNWADISFARGALLIQPSDRVDVTIGYLWQRTFAQDRSADNPYYGTQQPYVQYKDNLDPQQSELNLATLDVHVDVGFAQMTSATSYADTRTKSLSDSSGYLRTHLAAYYFGFPRLIAPIARHQNQNTFTEEVRLVSNGSGPLQWLFGGYYSRNHLQFSIYQPEPGLSDYVNALYGLNPTIDFGDVLTSGGSDKVSEVLAGYGEVTVKPTEKLSVTGGLRIFHDTDNGTSGILLPFASRSLSWLLSQPLSDTLLGGTVPVHFADTGAIFKVNLAYQLAPKALAYATWSQGYRAGGSNALPEFDQAGNSNAALLTYRPDKVNSYEIGAKGRTGSLTYTAALYWIEWRQMQQSLISNLGVSYIGNVPSARSRGLELSLNADLAPGLSGGLAYSYTDATVTTPFLIDASVPQSLVPAGAPLPGSSKHMITASIDYSVPLSATASLKLHADGAYRSASQSQFTDIQVIVGGVNTYPNNDFIRFPDTTIVNLSAGIDLGRTSITLFASNITNERGTNNGASAEFYGAKDQSYGVLRPRTIGLRATYRFGAR